MANDGNAISTIAKYSGTSGVLKAGKAAGRYVKESLEAEDPTLAQKIVKRKVENAETAVTVFAPGATALYVAGKTIAQGGTVGEAVDAVGDHFEKVKNRETKNIKNAVKTINKNYEETPTIVKVLAGPIPWLFNQITR